MQRFLVFQPTRWWFWIAIMLSLTGGVGVWGLIELLQLPAPPDCESQLSSKDSTASVFYCATTIADEQDVTKLAKAIELVSTIPAEHPQRIEGDRMIEKWSKAILDLSEIAFQQGEISKAVDTVKQIPDHGSARQLADRQVEKWKSIWSKAEAIYETAIAKIQDNDRDNSYLALTKAKELLHLGNDFWATTKYQELVHLIQDIKEKKEQARAQEEKYRLAQTITQPETSNPSDREQEAQDLAQLNKARTLANSGKSEDLRDAITEASLVVSNRYYEEAQKFIASTRNQIDIDDDRYSLKIANELASKNDVDSLQTAINQASLIAEDRLLYKEANKQIAKWNNKILKLQRETEIKQKQVVSDEQITSNNQDKLNLNHSNKLSEIEDKYLQNVKP